MDIRIIDTNPGQSAEYRWTLDAQAPLPASGVAYDAEAKPSLNAAGMIRAVAVQGERTSREAVRLYAQLSPPEVLPVSGDYSPGAPIAVSIPEGANVYYTRDGTTPDETSAQCRNAVQFQSQEQLTVDADSGDPLVVGSGNENWKFKAFKAGAIPSDAISRQYRNSKSTNLLVTVGRVDASGHTVIGYSPDGLAWTDVVLSATYKLTGVAYNGTIFLAVGATSGGAAGFARSADGETWTTHGYTSITGYTGATVPAPYRIAYGNGVWVAICLSTGLGSTDAKILSSSDGFNWVTRHESQGFAGSGADLYDVIYADGFFLVTTKISLTPRVFRSADGIAWEQVSLGNAAFRAGPSVYSPDLNRVVTGYETIGTYAGQCYRSADGQSWLIGSHAGGIMTGCWSSALGKFFTATAQGDIYSSADGVTFSKIATAVAGSGGFRRMSLVAEGEKLVLFADKVSAFSGSVVYTSEDGVTWTQCYTTSSYYAHDLDSRTTDMTAGPVASTVQRLPLVAFSPEPAGVVGTAVVTLSVPEHPDATIYYTTDGSEPTGTSAVYTGPITVATEGWVKAFAMLSGYRDSNVASRYYVSDANPNLPKPVITPDTGKPPLAVQLTVPGHADATIYYTTDGSDPERESAASQVGTVALQLTSDTRLRAFAAKTGYLDTAIASADFLIGPKQLGPLTLITRPATDGLDLWWELEDKSPANVIYGKVVSSPLRQVFPAVTNQWVRFRGPFPVEIFFFANKSGWKDGPERTQTLDWSPTNPPPGGGGGGGGGGSEPQLPLVQFNPQAAPSSGGSKPLYQYNTPTDVTLTVPNGIDGVEFHYAIAYSLTDTPSYSIASGGVVTLPNPHGGNMSEFRIAAFARKTGWKDSNVAWSRPYQPVNGPIVL